MGSIYASDGFRLEWDAPMRRWRLAFNGVMNENDEKIYLLMAFTELTSCDGKTYQPHIL